ncbi:peptidoglycan/xylan/chitin deacetylase (PgdA/CDA1 family) [Crossiella equi]|uniref:Peptidoglycan/xylan/chitin deacetylase (PgdA/CDA1 family) n=1 Tax=Crossiella equi TaxID=130796 RepID=A0ABS5A3V5_9PSEU|nr:polysaccharide deacetylase family protein [Crossiella equi]MBP2471254.1 peptidoglycan/xylan/chitin deacetylase (PgdA/CDA1 family) [Crossiella equi]
MLTRLGPFRYVAAAVLALLVVAVVLGTRSTPGTPEPAQAPDPTANASPAPAQRPVPSGEPAKVINKVETGDRVVFLTIDDGATRRPDMVDILKRNNVKATFFLTDQYVRQDPAWYKALRDQTGGSIENHTATHPNLKGKSLEEQRAEIGPVSDTYTREFGTRPTLFRPPFGNYDDNTLKAAGEAGAKWVVYWGSEIIDGKVHFSGPKEFRPGSIVLMHFRPTFEKDVQAFLDQARANDLTPALLSDYLK